MNKIVKYVKKIAIHYNDEGKTKVAYIDQENAQALRNDLNISYFIGLGKVMIPRRAINKIDFDYEMDTLEQFIYSQPARVRDFLANKDKELYNKVGHGITSIKHAQSIIERAKQEGLLSNL